MSLSLYDVTVPAFLQTLGGVAGFLEKGVTHFKANNVDPDTIVDVRLFPDMLPFWFQVSSVAHHTIDAINGVKAGVFSPGGAAPPLSYADLQKLIADAQADLAKVSADELNALQGNDMVFAMGEMKIPFTAEGFLMSFSLPNLHFHATTAYDILRIQGVKLGKRDYLGAMRTRT